MEKKDVFVGMKLYRDDRYEVREYVVSKVLNKYLELEECRDKITISSLMYENKEYSQCNYQLYQSKQEIIDRKEKFFLSEKIRKMIGNYGTIHYPLDILRKIDEILTTN